MLKKNNSMHFHKWEKNNVLQINKFGMLEPALSNHVIPDIMLIPLLAYDNLNNRLGYGGGFYDRYLNKYLKSNNNILTIGIAFSFQKHHKLPVSKEDVKLNYILTEKGIFKFKMNILILGDVVGPAGVKAVKEKLPKIIREKK